MVQWIQPYDMQRQSTLNMLQPHYANHNPSATIYGLVRQLLGIDKKLNAELIPPRGLGRNGLLRHWGKPASLLIEYRHLWSGIAPEYYSLKLEL